MRRAQVILLLCAVLLVVGCRPKGILTSRQMRSILYELHRADAIIQVAGKNYRHDDELAKYYQEVLDKNGITQAEFDSSLVWYTDHPQIFSRIYPKIVKRCEAEVAAMEEELKLSATTPIPPKRDLPPLDSIKHVMQFGFNPNLIIRLDNSSDDDSEAKSSEPDDTQKVPLPGLKANS